MRFTDKNTLSDLDIKEILKHYKISINGIYMKDEMPKLKNGFYVINLQSSTDGNGTHWTGLYMFNDVGIYFDSYGFPPPEDIENSLKFMKYNTREIQDYNSSSCGFYVIAFIKFLHNKRNPYQAFETFLNLFSNDTEKNENILYSILYD